MLDWIRNWFALPERQQRTPIRVARQENPFAAVREPEPADLAFPRALAGVGNLDRPETAPLAEREQAFFDAVAERVAAGALHLPVLPSTSMTAMDLAANTGVRIPEVVKALEGDPVLSSELLKTANSVLFAGTRPAATLHLAVVRIGLRNLRGLVLSLSMRSVIFRARGLNHYAHETWRQALAMGKLARIIARQAGDDPDQAFLDAMLQDIGKVPLLDVIRTVVPPQVTASRTLVGRVFEAFHERAGAMMAERWNFPAEVAAVAGCHHDFLANASAPRAAALASLAHKIDLQLTLGSESEYWDLRLCDEMQVLGISFEGRRDLLRSCVALFAGKELAVAV